MSKEIKLKIAILDDSGKLVKIPQFIQKHINQIEKRWFEKMKKLDENYKKQIHELEHRLSNCIVKPKFNVKDTIFVIVNNNIEEYFVDEILLRNRGTLWAYYDICKKTEITEKNEIFATEEEAKAKLEEMKNG